jgi:hypothetical protein
VKVQFIIAPDGATEVRALEGSFEGASLALKQAMAALRANGLTIAGESEPEQHRHDPEVHVHGHSHNR